MEQYDMDSYVEAWDVYNIFTTHTTPPKRKFIVIVATHPSVYGFFINSEITPFAKKRPKLLPCFAQISADYNTFLSYDSWVDCRRVYDFYEHELQNAFVNRLSGDAIQTVKLAVRNCPVLKDFFKKLILAN